MHEIKRFIKWSINYLRFVRTVFVIRNERLRKTIVRQFEEIVTNSLLELQL